MKFIDLTGNIYGRLTVIKRVIREEGDKQKWLCKCECGDNTFVEAEGSNLKNKHTQSCGCLKKERILTAITKHGQRQNRIYRTYNGIKNRCFNEKIDQYHNYGGRGITICKEWLGENGFINFFEWAMGNGYEDTLTIDRIDVNGNYEPDNCRWATNIEQGRNRRNNTLITINDTTKIITEWEREYNLGQGTINRRMKIGLTGEQLLAPVQRVSKKKSGERGITWDAEKEMWMVQIKGVYLKRFVSLEEAIDVKYKYINCLKKI